MKHGVDFIGVGVGVIIVRNNKILLMLRKNQSEWSIPGGKVELNEKSGDTAVREIKEELGIDIKIKKFLTLTETFSNKMHWVSIVYIADILKGDPRIMEPEEHADVKWFSLDDLPENHFLPSKLAIEFYKKNT
ncbi:NUDIX domain-containing protein [Candidatus Woesearchaeota archaeon]|nr:NUDIX domain-containing protein [Candidatus Woesearchaeota archaeon]